MKLFELTSVKIVPNVGPDTNRTTPVSALQNWGHVNAPLPDEFCKGREWCERKKKKKRKKNDET